MVNFDDSRFVEYYPKMLDLIFETYLEFLKPGKKPVVFLDEADIVSGRLDGIDVLFVSGGDTFAIAAALGQPGAQALERFIRAGGMYIGACAGAYLVLQSSLEPLHYFNFVQARIANLTSTLPPALQRPEKYCTAYGCRYVYHPVRGDNCSQEPSGIRNHLAGPRVHRSREACRRHLPGPSIWQK